MEPRLARIGARAGILLWSCSTIHPTCASSFANMPVGTIIEDVELRGPDGAERHLLEADSINVFMFVNPEQEHSLSAVRAMAELREEFAGKPVHWGVIVTDRAPQAAVESMTGRGNASIPVLLDKGDVLYGRFGVALFPVAGITDRSSRLAFYEPFSKVHYPTVIRARIRYLLGEIDQAEMMRAVAPPAEAEVADADVARRFLKLAEMLYQSGKYEKAAESVRHSIEKDETLVASHVLLGRVLAALGRCEEAIEAFERAKQLDPGDPGATGPRPDCTQSTGGGRLTP
ncbi:MAG: tetratricopeptide repeat protein [Acidobacteriota bacterium]